MYLLGVHVGPEVKAMGHIVRVRKLHKSSACRGGAGRGGEGGGGRGRGRMGERSAGLQRGSRGGF